MARKSFEQKVEEAKEAYIAGFVEEGCNEGTLKVHEVNLRDALRALRLREADITYHVRDAYARATGARQRSNRR